MTLTDPTNPTITYGHGKLFDFDTVTGWTERGTIAAGSFAVYNGDSVKITKTAANYYYIDNDTNLALSTSIYTKFFYRYKIGGGSIRAGIILEFSDASTQTILADATSATWATGSATITTAKTLDHIRLEATNDTGDVYYDFVLVCEGTFSFPNAESVQVIPTTDLVRTFSPSRVGRSPQTMGSDDTQVTIVCDLDVGNWLRTLDTRKGQVFLDINHNGSIDEEWQWLNTGQGHQFKARLETPDFLFTDDRQLLTLTFYELRVSSANNETIAERFGIT